MCANYLEPTLSADKLCAHLEGNQRRMISCEVVFLALVQLPIIGLSKLNKPAFTELLLAPLHNVERRTCGVHKRQEAIGKHPTT